MLELVDVVKIYERCARRAIVLDYLAPTTLRRYARRAPGWAPDAPARLVAIAWTDAERQSLELRALRPATLTAAIPNFIEELFSPLLAELIASRCTADGLAHELEAVTRQAFYPTLTCAWLVREGQRWTCMTYSSPIVGDGRRAA